MESEGRFQVMADAAPILIWMSGPDKRCTFVNQAWLEFTGRTLEQECCDGWSGGIHPEDREKYLKQYFASFDARDPFVMQYRLRHKDGEYRWVTDSGVPRYDAAGGFLGYVGACVDVTELEEKKSAARYRGAGYARCRSGPPGSLGTRHQDEGHLDVGRCPAAVSLRT